MGDFADMEIESGFDQMVDIYSNYWQDVQETKYNKQIIKKRKPMIKAKKKTNRVGTKKIPKTKTNKPKTETSVNTVSIPSEPTEPCADFHDYIISIYGDSGCGKTSLAAQFPGYVVAQFEPERKGLRIRKVQMDYISIDAYDETNRRPFKQFCNLVENALDDDSVRGLVIDTFNLCFDSCQDLICHDKGVTYPNDVNDFGKTWKEIPAMVRNVLSKWRESGKGLCFIDHSTTVEVEVNDDTFYRTQPNLRDSNTGSLPIIKETDLVIYYGIRSNGTRYMQIQPTKEVYCKSAIDDHFLTPDGDHLKMFEVGDTPAKVYKDLIDAFNNKKHNLVKKTLRRKTSK